VAEAARAHVHGVDVLFVVAVVRVNRAPQFRQFTSSESLRVATRFGRGRELIHIPPVPILLNPPISIAVQYLASANMQKKWRGSS
jgi:hypothetical protein